MNDPIVIVGSGLAGYFLAKELRQHDQERPLVIITASDGRFYSKPLLSTALTKQKTPELLSMGTAEEMAEKYHATVYTKSEVVAIDPKEKTITFKAIRLESNKVLDTADKPRYDARGEVIQDPSVKLRHDTSDGVIPDLIRNPENHNQPQQIKYSDLILACGAHKIKPPLEGDAISDIVSVNHLEDYENFRQWLQGKKHIGILGAGLVGCEFANDLANAGFQVTVMAPERHPLSRLVPETIGQMLLGAMAEAGVSWRLGQCAKAVNFDSAHYQVTLDDDSEVMVDGVMSAVGLKPNIDLAKAAGLKTARGILADSQLRTSDPHIYALGDCAEVNGEVLQFVAPLLQCARVISKVLSGQNVSLKYPVMPIVIKTPVCPVVVVPPPKEAKGEWYIEGEGSHLSALFKDSDANLLGFALLGDKVKEKMALMKQLPV